MRFCAVGSNGGGGAESKLKSWPACRSNGVALSLKAQSDKRTGSDGFGKVVRVVVRVVVRITVRSFHVCASRRETGCVRGAATPKSSRLSGRAVARFPRQTVSRFQTR